MVEAGEVGAPQRRRRWYCIGYLGKLPPPPLFNSDGYKLFARRWATEPKHRTICPGGATQNLTKEGLHGAQKRAARAVHYWEMLWSLMHRDTRSFTCWLPLVLLKERPRVRKSGGNPENGRLVV